MNGSNIFLDTNAIIFLLKGNATLELQLTQANWIGVSVISVVEFLAFPTLAEGDKKLFSVFLSRVEIVPLDADLTFLKKISLLRAKTKLKLPDAVIAQSAIEKNAVLFTNDENFKNVDNLAVHSITI